MSAPLKIRPVLDPVEECPACEGLGSVECEDCNGDGTRDCECSECHDVHERDCDACGGEGRYACDECHGFACLAAMHAWVQGQVLPLIPSDVLRGILRLAPHLDAAGLPRYGVRINGRSAQPTITVEVRRDDTEAEAVLFEMGDWIITRLCADPSRPNARTWSYRGPAARIDVQIATAGGLQ